MIRSSEYFIYANETSESYDILNVNVNSGMMEEPFVAPRNIEEVKVVGRDSPYFYGVTYEPLQFTLSFAFKDQYDSDKIRAVARWLTKHTYYQPLIFSENLDRVFYCLPVDSPMLIHNGLSQGYITITMRCDGPYSYSQYHERIFDLSSNSLGGTTIQFSNLGDENIKPEIFIQKVENGNVKIVNNTDDAKFIEFTSLLDEEELFVDCENEDIQTINLSPTTNRYLNMNGDFMRMVYGDNHLHVTGKCILKFRYRYKFLQG